MGTTVLDSTHQKLPTVNAPRGNAGRLESTHLQTLEKVSCGFTDLTPNHDSTADRVGVPVLGFALKGGMVNLERKKQRTTNMHTSAPEHGDHDGTLTIDQACTIPELRT